MLLQTALMGKRKQVRKAALSILIAVLASAMCMPHGLALEISDSPLASIIPAAPPNIMFLLDNSQSTDSEFMAFDPGGRIHDKYYVFPGRSYKPHPDLSVDDKYAFDEQERKIWCSQWHGFNHLYYNPGIDYAPWPQTKAHPFTSADLHFPLSNPMHRDITFKLSETFFKSQTSMGAIDIPNAHYFIVEDKNDNGLHDPPEAVYLVAWQDNDRDSKLDISGRLGEDKRYYYRLNDNGNYVVESNELTVVVDENEKQRIRLISAPKSAPQKPVARTDKEDLQNFANWFTYYRRGQFVVKAVVADAISRSQRIQIGLYATHHSPRLPVLALETQSSKQSASIRSDRQSYNEMIIEALYKMTPNGHASLRVALDQVGRYYHQKRLSPLGISPFSNVNKGGACQSAAVVVITDGRWRDTFHGLGNIDGDLGKPFADAWNDTLSDIAMFYYKNDLAPDLPDIMPAMECNNAIHQHLKTYALCFGNRGYLATMDIDNDGKKDNPDYFSDPCFLNSETPLPVWPEPIVGSSAMVDDIWHAAVNGRGIYNNPNSVSGFRQSLDYIMSKIDYGGMTAAIPLTNNCLIKNGVLFQTTYNPYAWTGDIRAYAFKSAPNDTFVQHKQFVWSASDQLSLLTDPSETRRIITYGGPWRPPAGIPFRYQHLSEKQRILLGYGANDIDSHRSTEKIVEYIRGRTLKSFRHRPGLIGDVVHCNPVIIGDTLFVGANDGMLHAFNARNGNEVFAYAPNLVFPNLSKLTYMNYPDNHRFFVDGPLSIGDVMIGRFKRNSYLIGGLGKGGKGYYCLLVRRRERSGNGPATGAYQDIFHVDHYNETNSENDFSKLLQWEYPRPDQQSDGVDNNGNGFIDESGESDPDMGFSYSEAYAVNANTDENNYTPVVIFGNGYDSPAGGAVLYIVDAQSGVLIRKIDTGTSGDNGLSTPALIDVNLDRCVDYAYAGDLKGNLWKFDLTGSVPANWGVAYGTDVNTDGVIDAAHGDLPSPLFTATGQSITGRPDVMRMQNVCLPQAPGYMVVFGTGQFFGPADLYNDRTNSIYGIWDFGDDADDKECLGRLIDKHEGLLSCGLKLLPRKIIERSGELGQNDRIISNEGLIFELIEDQTDEDGVSRNNHGVKNQQGNPKEMAGWFLDFPEPAVSKCISSERVTRPITIRGGHAVITSFVPASSYCSSQSGTSWIYVLKACTGQMPIDSDEEPFLPSCYPSRLNDMYFITKNEKRSLEDTLMTCDQFGQIHVKTIPGEKWGKVFWRENLENEARQVP